MSEAPRKLSFNFETIGSIAAMFIGACALFVAWDQAQVMRRQQHASVWPIISPDLYIDGDAKSRFVEIKIENAGVGPALMKSLAIEYDGKPISRWSEIERGLFDDHLSGPMGFTGEDVEGGVIAAGETVSFIKASWQASEEIDKAFTRLSGKYVSGDAPSLLVKACYCSVFERCWAAVTSAPPARVKECPPPTGFFQASLADVVGQDQ